MNAATWDLFFRWGHFLAGITWIGLLYYFNFVQVPYLKAVTAEAKAQAFKHLVPRALVWFRYSALATWLFGVFLLGTQNRFGKAFLLQDQDAVIGMGAWLGTIMLINVWGIIWRNQKKVLGLAPATAEEKTRAARMAFLASRTNTMLSIPMLFFMAASGHPEAGIF
ncbi:MAG TPA: urate hydroxylase PuuD [Nitrospiria bacterium]|nr:urate hydroxylase PuuD [Nitrospiria bacterium]